jgi:hypothetical protein
VPVTVAKRSRSYTVFARLEAGIVGSNPTQGMDVWCLCVCMCMCVRVFCMKECSRVSGLVVRDRDEEAL